MKFSASYPITDRMSRIINYTAGGLGGVGAVGGLVGPGADLAIIAPIWVGMVAALADEANVTLEPENIKKLTLASATGIVSFVGGTKIAAMALGWVGALFTGGASLAVSAAANAAINAKLTHAYGKAVAQFFLQADRISLSDAAVPVLLALTATHLGVPVPNSDLLA